MVALITLMLKMTILLERLTLERLAVGDNEINRFGVGCGVEHVKKSKKTSKSQNLTKSGKKLSKSGNTTNFDATEARPKFLTPNAKTTFNCLQLAFIKAPIL